MGMRGGMDMKGGGGGGGGGNYRGNNDSWGGNSGVHSIHMRGLPFKATEQDIADVSVQHFDNVKPNFGLPFFPGRLIASIIFPFCSSSDRSNR